MKYRWNLAPAQPHLTVELVRRLNLSPVLAQCLVNRGLRDPVSASRFLEPKLRDLADPFLLPDMEKAVERLSLARGRRERIVIFGDYDVDGITSTALLTETLRRLGLSTEFYLPNRIDEGYGLSQESADNCLRKFRPGLILAVDCGSSSASTIACVQDRGVDVIVLDHHQLGDPVPKPVALVNPQAAPSGSGGTPAVPFGELCSAGLAFKLAHALVKHGRQSGWSAALEFDLRPLLDLVALGTVADLVPLTGENRILVSVGLERLTRTERPGLVALKSVAAVHQRVGAYEVGFQLAPRLNAAGRLEDAEQALRLVLADTLEGAEPMARRLDAQNRERQQIERTVLEEVLDDVRTRIDGDTFVIVEGKVPWHIGVVGIVASRVSREFHRPTIILGGDGEHWRGSGRSIEGFDMAAALRECAGLLVRHGGHSMAAGLSINPSNLAAFRKRLNDLARSELKGQLLKPTLRLDLEVPAADLTLDRVRELEKLGPTGQGNPCVQIVVRNLTHQRPPRRIGKERQHGKYWINNGPGFCEALWWNQGAAPAPEGCFDLAAIPEVHEYEGNSSVQLKILDWQPAAG